MQRVGTDVAMNEALRTLLLTLLNRHYIGGKHTPEEKLIRSKTKWLGAHEQKEFEKEYKRLVNEGFIFQTKKMTGRSSDWHISLNPRTLKELYELVR